MKTYSLFFILSVLSYSLSAQTEIKTSSSKKEKKVVTVKKSVDKDGNEVIEKKILEGDAVKKLDEENDRVGRTIHITIDSNGHEHKVIMDQDTRIMDDQEKGLSIFSGSGGGYSERTVVIRKNQDGSVEIKEKSGNDIANDMHVKIDSSAAKRPSLGVSLNDDLKITQLVKDGAAEKAGLEEGDQLTHLDGTFINDYDHLKELLSKRKVGDKAELTYLRDRKEMKSTLTLKGGSTRVYFNR
jgi:C-terminal processing protease CtpA/Prc